MTNKKLPSENARDLPRVLIASSECAPLSKTGGLGDVIGMLPGSLLALGADVRVITPYHKVVREAYTDKIEPLCDFDIDIADGRLHVRINRLMQGDVTVYLVENHDFFDGPIYKTGPAQGEQYAFFCRAVLDCLPHIGFLPDVLHCNDWHTGAIPLLLKTSYKNELHGSIKTLLTIHNIAYQGIFEHALFRRFFDTEEHFFAPDCIGDGGGASFMRAGCLFADRLSTVSPGYAGEVCTAEYGEGLESVLTERRADFIGIVNGIDTALYDPQHDRSLAANFSAEDMSGKKTCKASLLDEAGLSLPENIPLIGMVTRLVEQKGIDLVISVIDEIIGRGAALVLVGTGDRHYEDAMREAESRHPGHLRAFIGYDETLARRVYAGSDIFLMPSRFEPCGLSQMIAMRYGTLPLVRETGGLIDTVSAYNRSPDTANGFSFKNYHSYEMLAAIFLSLEIYREKPEIWARLMQNAMNAEFSLSEMAKKYLTLYSEML